MYWVHLLLLYHCTCSNSDCLARRRTGSCLKILKGTTTVIMKRENKINEGQKQLDDRNNYQPLEKPMVKDTSQRVKHLINTLHNEGFIDEMTVKWFNRTPDPPRIPVFYTLTKIHKPTLVGRPIISGCDGPTERLSSFVDKLLQPIAQIQDSYLKDTTHFIRFIENTRVPSNAFLVSMDTFFICLSVLKCKTSAKLKMRGRETAPQQRN